jgi:hypothetical protein
MSNGVNSGSATNGGLRRLRSVSRESCSASGTMQLTSLNGSLRDALTMRMSSFAFRNGSHFPSQTACTFKNRLGLVTVLSKYSRSAECFCRGPGNNRQSLAPSANCRLREQTRDKRNVPRCSPNPGGSGFKRRSCGREDISAN